MAPGMAEAIQGALVDLRAAVAPCSSRGAYLNFAEAPTDTSTAFSSDTFATLQAVKAQYDPADLIHANHPIAPAAR